jgi:DoxX-like family
MTTAMLWTGRTLTGIFALFMLGASVAPKLLQMPVAEETMAQLGWPAGYAFMIGIIELACVVLYLVPRTSVLGAVLTMGLLGGAMATQIRAGSPLFSHILFSIYLGLFMWGGLWLRDPRLRALFPFAAESPGAADARGSPTGSAVRASHQ